MVTTSVNMKEAALVASANLLKTSDNALKAVEIGAPALKDASTQFGARLGVEAVAKLAPVAWVFVGLYGAVNLFPIGKEIYTAAYPSEEQVDTQKANTILSRKRLEFLQAEEAFRNCLVKAKADSELNAEGCPVDCEKDARFFACLGGNGDNIREFQ